MTDVHGYPIDALDPERWIRVEVAESQRWADAARRRADAELRQRRRFAKIRLAAITLAAAAVMYLALTTPEAQTREVAWSYGVASVYDDTGPTASGRHYRYGVAHRSLPFGTRLRICLRRRCVTATVADRGPFIAGRVLDLSLPTAAKIGSCVCLPRVRWRILR